MARYAAGMRGDRLVSLLLLLQARGRMTPAALAAELEVSERTIYRDLADLSAAGVPISEERGEDGGCRLLDGYRTNLTGPTAGEAGTLLLTGAAVAEAVPEVDGAEVHRAEGGVERPGREGVGRGGG